MKKIIFKGNLSYYVGKAAQLLFISLLLLRAVNRDAISSQKFTLLFYVVISIVIITSFRNIRRRVMLDPMQLKLLTYMVVLFPIIALIITFFFSYFK